MSVPSSMVHRSGNALIVRSVVSGDVIPPPPPAPPGGVATPLSRSKDEEEEEEETTKRRSDVLPDCKVKRNYTCGLCDFFTQNPRIYLYHLRDVHKERVRVYECPNCLYASRHFQKLLRHTKMVHGRHLNNNINNNNNNNEGSGGRVVKKRRRNGDDGVAVVVEEAEEEEEEQTNDDKQKSAVNVFKCSVCDFTAKNQMLLSRHEKTEHIKTKFFRCSKCTYVTHIKARYTKHVKYHSMPMIKCDMCDFRTPYKWNLDRHCKNHNGNGAFRCSACNFTADIKQSLTVHEMNHHVPPVGQAAGLGVGRRRNKVGASDSCGGGGNSEEVQAQCYGNISNNSNNSGGSGGGEGVGEDAAQKDVSSPKKKNKKLKKEGEEVEEEEEENKINASEIMVKHKTQKKVHQIKRPVPNLIPIPILKTAFIPDVSEPEMSQKELTEICRKSTNSSLKDLASLFSSEDLITPPFTQPQNNANNLNNASTFFKKSDKKNASFFDNLRAKLNLTNDLICKNCRYESKCLTEHAKHVQTCSDQKKLSVMLKNKTLTNSTRCQYCRQRCKTSSDLIVHLQKCHVALQSQNTKIDEEEEESCSQSNAHPMENKIFIWNDIIAPIHVEEYQENTLDLSLKNTPVSGATDHNSNAVLPHPEKIPTHGNDIATAQHKRVFKCPHCTFWASTASRFHVHIVGHLNKKPFECSLCSYRSNWRWDITKHIKLKSVRDKSHETAKVLMTDETGRRNYTKYNKYLTEIQISNEQTLDTSGGCGTRPRSAKNSDATLSRVKTGDSKSHKGEFLNNSDMTLLHLHSKNDATLPKSSDNLDPVLPRLQKVPTSAEFGDIFKNVTTVRPLPDLVTVEGLMTKVRDKRRSENGNGKKTLFKCKKCNFKDVSRDVLLEHVKGHYQNVMDMQPTLHQANEDTATAQDLSIITRGTISDDDDYNDEASLNGNIASSTYGNGASISTNSSNNFNNNGGGNAAVAATAPFRCGHCNQVSNWKHVIQRHCRLKHHGDIRVVTTKNGLEKLEIDDSFDNLDNQEEEEETNEEHGNVVLKKFKCQTCPYVTNSKSQFVYHKQFHNKDKKGQYTCQHCTYNVSKRHLLHQHMKVHGINMASHRQNGDMIDPVLPVDKRFETQMVDDTDKMADIPLVWVSKNGKFTKMFKCRFCPHVNLRKVNITEHEKMHRTRTSNVTSSTEHKCSECNYVCNNAGVLSSHTKVHQGLYGTIIHKMVDLNRTDEEQIKEMTTNSGNSAKNATGKTIVPISGTELFLQKKTRAAILEQNGSQDEITDQDGGLEEEEEEFRCVLCPYSCSDKQKVAEHQQMHKSIGDANEMEYKCDHCDFQCDNAAQLAEHIDCHLSWNRKVEKMLKNSKYYMWSDAAITIKNETNEGEVIFEEKQNGDEEECKIELHEEKFIINNNNNDDGDRERCLLDFKHGNTVSVIKEEEESDMDVD